MDKRKYSRLKEDPSQLQMFADEAMDNINEQHHEIGQIEETLPNKASLVDGKVPSTELPSYVDDVVEYASLNDFPEEGEQGKIYLAIDTGFCYRWSGTQYIQIAGSTSVLMFASQSNFPAEGEEGVIYVAEDNNKQYRWNGTVYVELGGEDELEIYTGTVDTSVTLTAEQIKKAKEGKFVIRYQDHLLVASNYVDEVDHIILFESYYSRGQSGYGVVPEVTGYMHSFVQLNCTTRKFLSRISSSIPLSSVRSTSNNFINATDDPSSNDIRIIRALNLRKTQDMMSDVYDASATYDVGDVVIYQNDLYVCNTAISTAESWTAAHWTKTTVAEIAKEKGANIVEISSLGVQSDEMAAKIENAKAIYVNAPQEGKRLYVKYEETSTQITFIIQNDAVYETFRTSVIYTRTDKTLFVGGNTYNRVASLGGAKGTVGVDASLTTSGSLPTSRSLGLTGKLPYLTTAPTADNTSGFITIVVLSAEPATRYAGYLYIITGSN